MNSILAEIADTARPGACGVTFLHLTLPQGHLLCVEHFPDNGLKITTSRLTVRHDDESGTSFGSSTMLLAHLRVSTAVWASDPEERWTRVQAALHDHAQRPQQLEHLLSVLCIEMQITVPGTLLLFARSSNQGWDVAVHHARSQVVPYAARIAALKALTVSKHPHADALVPNAEDTVEVAIPSSAHQRMAMLADEGGLLAQIERLEALWLPPKETAHG